MKHLKTICLALTLICTTAISYGQTKAECGVGMDIGDATADYDTITTSSSTGTKAHSFTLKGNQETVAGHIKVTKISGTISGYIQWQISSDGGVSYKTIATDTLSDATATYYHEWTERPQYYKALVTMSSSTQSTAYRFYRCHRPKVE